VASIDKRPNGRYRTRWREYPGRRFMVAERQVFRSTGRSRTPKCVTAPGEHLCDVPSTAPWRELTVVRPWHFPGSGAGRLFSCHAE
jgi:hypothetical protein